MKSKLLYSVSFALMLMPALSFADDLANTDKDTTVVVVTASKPVLPTLNVVAGNPIENDGARDAGALIENQKGVAIIRHGAQTGLIQLRGLSQDRVKVRIDGVEIVPACPNHMDPPFHYVGTNDIGAISIANGATSIADSGDSIAGTITVNTKSPEFATGDKEELSGDLSFNYSDANRGTNGDLGLNLGFAKAAFRLSGGFQNGGDLEYKGGAASVTGYKMNHYKFEGEFLTPIGQIGFGAGGDDSRNVGTPALAMDMVYDHAETYRIGLIGDYSFGKLTARIFHNDIDHIMDNYGMRTYNTTSRMNAPATSTDNGYFVSLDMPLSAFNLKVGSDGHLNDFDVYMKNIANGMISQSFNESSRDRYGVFAEIDGKINQHIHAKLGVRYDNIKTDTHDITKSMMSDAPYLPAFNGTNHERTFDNYELSAGLRWHVVDALVFEFMAAQKMRAPSIVELYLYKPSATYGSADGRNYMGNQDLDSETSRQISADAYITLGNLKLNPSIFYNKVSDYIQGVAMTATPGATLKFQNIDAEIYGAEFSADYALNDNWALFGAASYVHGEDTTHNDNLYRLSPLRGIAGVKYDSKHIEAMLETKMVAKQDKVSAYNGEQATPSYTLVNLRGRLKLNENAGLNFGVENVFDKFYYDHLSGINRVNDAALGGNLAIGQKIPGAGRTFYMGVNYKF